jgi:xeroderma pigmentosum group C-complementing protein
MAPKREPPFLKTPAPSSANSSTTVRRPNRRAALRHGDVPEVYSQMLSEADELEQIPRRAKVAAAVKDVEPPLKRKRPGEGRGGRSERIAAREATRHARAIAEELLDVPDDVDEDVQFEDVSLPAPVIQTVEGDSEDEEEEGLLEDVDFSNIPTSPLPNGDRQLKDLELNLTAQANSTPRRSVDRRKPLTRIERKLRLEIHKVHLLCLMAHVARRNHWCNDHAVQDSLRPLLTDKVIDFLNPSSKLSQFGQTESLKRGLEMASKVFRLDFRITERGFRRALWADKEEHLTERDLPADLDSAYDREDFQKAAQQLSGSRDTGAQLFCALLRSVGVEARLVCSLQPLSFLPGGPTMLKPKKTETPSKLSKAEKYRAAMAKYEQSSAVSQETNGAVPSPRRRLGHPNAAAYLPPSSVFTPSDPVPDASADAGPKHIMQDESAYPVYWVEVLDVAHQKWQPVDPLVTQTQWKPRALEPPASDRENNMSYVMAFEADGSAKDVTRRYAKAYNAKTRRMRVDGGVQDFTMESMAGESPASMVGKSMSGTRWLRHMMRRYTKRRQTDVDQIEDNELAAFEAHEPMPRNVADFKDHPIYALLRHLRRHEVLVPGAQVAGTVGAGQKGPLEKIYRRRDVRVARSREKWYRLGREVRPGEEPVKILEKKAAPKRGWGADDLDARQAEEDEEDDKDDLFGANAVSGTPIFTFEQTELYVPPPIVNGRIPKNKFGNLDIYVPSMVPAGGAHVLHDRAAEAAHMLGIDYAPALTGFSFKGRQGTAVLSGVVVAKEHKEAVRVVADGFIALERELEDERRTRAVLRMWRVLLRGLRIRERIWAGAEDGSDDPGTQEEHIDARPDEGEMIEPTAVQDRKGKRKSRRIVSDDEDDVEDEEEPPLSDGSDGYQPMDDDDLGGGFMVD